MARYNHFVICPYERILFESLKIGDEFRVGQHRNGRISFPIALKTGELTYMKKKSKEDFRIGCTDNFMVYKKQ